MLPLFLGLPPRNDLSVLAIGAHPDDVEIGAGGLLLDLADSIVESQYVILTGSPDRQSEARSAAHALFGAKNLTIQLHDLPEGRLPALWGQVKEIVEAVATSFAPDLIVAPSPHDAHQDHRTIAEIIPTVFRDALCLGYEIPKWDGDLVRPSIYYPLSDESARRKLELLNRSFPSQLRREWWDDEVFLGLARLRGVECHSHYAEAFTCSKLQLATRPCGAVGTVTASG